MTKIEKQGDNDYNDPQGKVIGIVTLEDIIEEIIADEIADEDEEEHVQRKMMKRKLALLYTDTQAEKSLSEDEMRACLEFLARFVKPFMQNRIKKDLLHVLIRQSIVLDIKSDESVFSHNIDQMDDLNANNNQKTAMNPS